MKAVLTVTEQVTHEIEIDVDDSIEEQMRSEDVDPSDEGQVQGWFTELDEDDQLITDVIGDDTVTEVNDRSIQSVRIKP